MSSYKGYVKKAKRLIELTKLHQSGIAKLALKACEIRHGGKHGKLYTLTDFARDTGIPRKTLGGWVTTYRDVLLKSGIENPTKDQWTNGAKVTRLAKSLKKESGKKSFIQKLPKYKVKKLLKEVSKEESNVWTEDRALSYSRNILANIKKLNLDKANSETLKTIMVNIDEASDLINEHLTLQLQKGA